MSWFIGLVFLLLWWNLHRTLWQDPPWGPIYSLATHAVVIAWLQGVDDSDMGYAYALIIALPMLLIAMRSRRPTVDQ